MKESNKQHGDKILVRSSNISIIIILPDEEGRHNRNIESDRDILNSVVMITSNERKTPNKNTLQYNSVRCTKNIIQMINIII